MTTTCLALLIRKAPPPPHAEILFEATYIFVTLASVKDIFVALVQLDVAVGSLDSNAGKILYAARRAAD